MDTYSAPSGAAIHVDTGEEQGQKAFGRRGPKQHEYDLWSFVVGQFPYDAVLDLGANYGQVSLAVPYLAEVPIHLVEANPQLIPYIERSVATHPNREQMRLHNVALGDREGKVKFFVRPDALGKSSVVRKQGKPIRVPITRLGALVDLPERTCDVIAKIDVEGSELAVLRGARGLLEELDNYTIMIELHPGFMRSTAGSLGQFLENLCGYGHLWQRARSGRIRPFDFSSFVHKKKIRDILVVSGDRHLEAIKLFNERRAARIATQDGAGAPPAS